ncbi:ATP-binding protein [Spirosoma sp. 209]|uniref:sensor histidine kinase n=1 Tax=Spirosoma sp. 209 TaxID=1955701 RepID=UPI00098D271D|nr:ATP-binding protein [Spirosoma sp. 209]
MKSPSMTPSENPVQLRAALSLSGNAIMLFECLRTALGEIQDFRLILANRKAEEVVGMSEQDMLNRNSTDLFPTANTVNIWEQARRVVETGQPYEVDFQPQLNDQLCTSWFSLTLQRYGDGLAASFVDITALRQQKDLTERILNGSINGMVTCEALRNETGTLYDLRIRLVNDAAARLIRKPVSQLIGDTLFNQPATLAQPELLPRCIHTVETGESQRFESRISVNGIENWYDISISKLSDGLLMTFIDITAAKHHEQELNLLIENLKRSNQNLERFAYVASHDLQEPLRKIQSFGDILRSQSSPAVDDHSRELIDRMQSAASRMNTLIRDLLTFSRLSTQSQPFRTISLPEVVRDVLTDLEATIHEKQAQVEVTSLPTVLGDALQLRQVFQNLLSNALKFAKPASGQQKPHIRIDCEQVPGSAVRPLPGQPIAASDTSRLFYAISVTDNGIGFDEKYLDRIFTIFQRLHTRSEYDGTGIGLTIVQKVVENHRGYISARSQPGQGATFTIYLPALL